MSVGSRVMCVSESINTTEPEEQNQCLTPMTLCTQANNDQLPIFKELI